MPLSSCGANENSSSQVGFRSKAALHLVEAVIDLETAPIFHNCPAPRWVRLEVVANHGPPGIVPRYPIRCAISPHDWAVPQTLLGTTGDSTGRLRACEGLES